MSVRENNAKIHQSYVFLLCLLCVLCLIPTALAGDRTEALREQPTVDVLVCSVTAAEGERMTVRVERSERGGVSVGQELELARIELVSGVDESDRCTARLPQQGDVLVVNVDVSAEPIGIVEPTLCAFVERSDADGVVLVTAGRAMLERLNEYLNTGWYGQRPITSTEKQAQAEETPEESPVQKSSEEPTSETSVVSETNIVPVMIAAGLVAGACAGIALARKRKT